MRPPPQKSRPRKPGADWIESSPCSFGDLNDWLTRNLHSCGATGAPLGAVLLMGADKELVSAPKDVEAPPSRQAPTEQ